MQQPPNVPIKHPKKAPDIIPLGPSANLYNEPATKPPSENSKMPSLPRNLDIIVLNPLKKKMDWELKLSKNIFASQYLYKRYIRKCKAKNAIANAKTGSTATKTQCHCIQHFTLGHAMRFKDGGIVTFTKI